MPRILMFLAVVVLCGAWSAAPADAQVASPAAQATGAPAPKPADEWPDWIGHFDRGFPRGPGGYLSLLNVSLLILVFWMWISTSDWVNRDAQELKLNYKKWNLAVWGPFAALFMPTFIIPWFYLSLVLLIAAWVVPLMTYVRFRNRQVTEAERAFGIDHARRVLAEKLEPLGIKIRSTPKRDKSVAPVTLVARGAANPADDQKRMITARQAPGHDPARSLLYRGFHNRSTATLLDYTADAVGVRFSIDSVWIDGEKLPRAVGDPLLSCLKILSGLRPEERRARQTGSFHAVDESDGKKYICKITAQGTKTGERVLLQIDDPNLRKRKIEDLGLRQKTLDDLQALLSSKQGLIILAAPTGNGLTTIVSSCLSAIDRFTRSVMAVEDIQAKDLQVENVPVTSFNSLEQESPMTKLPGVIRQFPDILVVPELMNAETATLLCEEATSEDRLVFTTVRAKEAAEALLRPMLTKVPPKKYAVAVSGVLVQRLIRKLCDQCREAYPPPPQILQRLGIPADKVPAFYRPPTQPRQEVCSKCGGLGYHGLTAIHELLVVNDMVRQQLIRDPSLEAVRTVAKKSGMKTFEDEGLLLVVKGVTSVPELARVLKEGTPAPA